jgi:multiple sugar transport system permease protein
MIWLMNSLINATLHTVIVLVVSSLAAYAFARFTFKGRDTLFFIMLGTMMIPNVLNLVPLYSIINAMDLVDTRWALILPGVSSVFGVFLLRQFFLGIPKELEEAAVIDGAGPFRIFTRIMLPVIKPGLIVLGLFTFLANWNDYLWPLTAINTNEERTLTLGLAVLKGTYNVLYAKMMTVTLISIIPIIIIFIFAQKYFMKGINLSSGIKG